MSVKKFAFILIAGLSLGAPLRADQAVVESAVYVTRSGKSYHHDGCRFLSWSKKRISISDAKKQYKPCSYCLPDLNLAQAPHHADRN
ncbi:MAG TPA: hypothetical protein P5079_07440 [Elusimicrobiota bacterium]|nr:hypothetical protein [Elusimicrobiota bacterium]